LLPQRSKHPREMVLTPKASTSNFTCARLSGAGASAEFVLLPCGVARCGRSAGSVLCALWAVSAAVCFFLFFFLGGGTLWG